MHLNRTFTIRFKTMDRYRSLLDAYALLDVVFVCSFHGYALYIFSGSRMCVISSKLKITLLSLPDENVYA